MHTLNLLYRVCFFLFTFYMRVYVLYLVPYTLLYVHGKKILQLNLTSYEIFFRDMFNLQ